MALRDTLLVISESAEIRTDLRNILGESFNILEASSDSQSRMLFSQNTYSIAAILVDALMISDGGNNLIYDICRSSELGDTPVVAITNSLPKVESDAFSFGACDVVAYPFHHIRLKNRLSNILRLFREKRDLEAQVSVQKGALQKFQDNMVDALTSVVEYRNAESGKHILRIRRFTKIILDELSTIAPEFKLTPETIQLISSAASLHDIGKIAIPDAILSKPGKLTEEEYETMKTHTTQGADILSNLGNVGNEAYLRYAYNICMYHHERWDGGGYPKKLSGNDIPICAQVVGLADAFDALTTDRVYKKAIPYLDAYNMILNGECGAFSPLLLECFKHTYGQIEELARTYADGYSPKSDTIEIPLPKKEPNENFDSLAVTISKYHALLHHFNVTASEYDHDRNSYHLLYNPYPELMGLHNNTNFIEALNAIRDRVHPDDLTSVYSETEEYLNRFFESGLRKSTRHYRILGLDGEYHYFDATIIRVNTRDSKSKKAIGLWHRRDENTLSTPIAAKHELPDFFGITQTMTFSPQLPVEEPSKHFLDMTGYTAEEFEKEHNNSFVSLISPKSREKFIESVNTQFSTSPFAEFTVPLLRKDGSRLSLMIRAIANVDESGKEILNCFIYDVSHTLRSRGDLISSLTLYRTVIEAIGDIFFEYDSASDCLTCSDEWKNRFGYECISSNASTLLRTSSHIHPDDIEAFVSLFTDARNTDGIFEAIVRIADSNAVYSYNRIRAINLSDESGNSKIVGLISDIDMEFRHSQVTLNKLEKDNLTDLVNKEACRTKIEYMLSNDQVRSGAFIIIDLDNFKDINDLYGHMFGDGVLINIAKEISEFFREKDIVARIGGDEFLIFMPNISNMQIVEERCNLVINCIEKLYNSQLAEVQLSCSIGVAMLREDIKLSYSDLFQQADRALYHAKNKGKGCVAFYSEEADMQAYRTSVSKRIDSDSVTISNHELMKYVLDRLYNTGDVHGTINSLIEMIGKQMNVSRVYVFENNDDNTHCFNTFEWCNEGIEPQIDILQAISYETDIPDYEKQFNENAVFYCPDIKELPQHLRDILEPQGIKSMLQYAIRDNGVFRGYVGFDENTHERMWTHDQISLLSFVSKLISVFLLKQRTHDRTVALLEDLCNVLERQNAWTYIIDPSSYGLSFINGKVFEVAPEAKIGTQCYKALMGLDAPCPDCPIKLNGGKGGSCVITNDYLNLKVTSNALPIKWEGRDQYLITCNEYKDE
ncbi:MAG: diguanylate cyclase [Clostridia bacterium]|nr:diguanylate cyclase [Clostridia bacterium]